MYLISENREDLERYFIKQLDPDVEPIFNKLFDALIETRSCIAGGSLLSYVNKDPINDIDIYVPTKEYVRFLQLITEEEDPFVSDILTVNNHNISSKYDESFFKKNKIRIRYTFTIHCANDKSINVDVMLIDTEFLNVVTNFDLTFCEIFFDGQNLYTTSEENLENIRFKKGFLKPDYHKAFYQQNIFIHGRIRKYKERGYQVYIKGNKIHKIHLCDAKKKIEKIQKKTIENEEEYIVKTLIDLLFDSDHMENIQTDMYFLYINILNKCGIPLKEDEQDESRYKQLNIAEIIFVSLLDNFTLDSLLDNLIKSYNSDLGECLYIYLFSRLEVRMKEIQLKQNFRYAHWYYFNFLLKKLTTSVLLKNRIAENHPDAEHVKYQIMKMLNRYSGKQPGSMFVHLPDIEDVYEAFKVNEISDETYKEADRLTYEYFFKKDKCNLINPTGAYQDTATKKLKTFQLQCFVSSKQNMVCDIIQNYLYLPFNFIVLNDYYFNNAKRIRFIEHDLSKPADMNRAIDYDPQEMTFNLVEGDEISIEEALASKHFVFKYMNSYFHYDEKSLNQSLTNKDSWMYECLPLQTGEVDYNTELFVKLNGTASFLIPCNYLYNMFYSKNRIFEIIDTDRILARTASFKNTKYGVAMDIHNHVSSNHCQGGSDLKVYKLVCEDTENAELRPLFNNNSFNSLNNHSFNSVNNNSRPLFNNNSRPSMNKNLGGYNKSIKARKGTKRRKRRKGRKGTKARKKHTIRK